MPPKYPQNQTSLQGKNFQENVNYVNQYINQRNTKQKNGEKMTIEVISNSLTINGNFKTISHFQEIKEVLDRMITTHNVIELNLNDSISITSSLIGYLNKIIHKDKILLSLKTKNMRVYTLLDDLNLERTFNVKLLRS